MASGAKGREFESRRARHKFQVLAEHNLQGPFLFPAPFPARIGNFHFSPHRLCTGRKFSLKNKKARRGIRRAFYTLQLTLVTLQNI